MLFFEPEQLASLVVKNKPIVIIAISQDPFADFYLLLVCRLG
uniref:Uncharacterized protein n=1 Tax=Rhizophora mucronata TaxID=61149 RepID=A0A2P2PRL3_RHIMU